MIESNIFSYYKQNFHFLFLKTIFIISLYSFAYILQKSPFDASDRTHSIIIIISRYEDHKHPKERQIATGHHC